MKNLYCYILLLSVAFPFSLSLASNKTDTIFYKAELESTNLPLMLKIINLEDTTQYLISSPLQSKENFPPSKVKYIEDSLSLGFKKLGIVLHLKANEDSTELKGTFTQRFLHSEIVFKKQDKDFALLRPQTPLPPFSYKEKELTFRNPECEYEFHGTLTYPEKEGKYPCVVLVSGSGAQDRNCEIYQHKPFLVIADYLTKNGYAVFRYDDRGWGYTDEKMYKGTTKDFAHDAYCAMQMLKNEDVIDQTKIGIAGHSEGGLIAQMLCAEHKDIAFAILMAAPGIDGKKVLTTQLQLQYADKPTLLEQQLNTYVNREYDTTKVSDYWLDFFVRTDPVPFIKKMRCPTLVLQGEKDFQVILEENLPQIRKNIHKKAIIKTYPDLNHLFQHYNPSQPTNYALIEETISTDVLKDILDFLNSLYKK